MANLRKASTLVLVADSIGQSLKILALKRGSSSNNFPLSHVFPGGNCDPADNSEEWLKLLPQHECDIPFNIAGLKESFTPLSLAVSSRITAIRETFEECGILICKRPTDQEDGRVAHYEIEDEKGWRRKIQKDAGEFLNLCQIHECYPNIKGLHLLNDWITPLCYQNRFDCMFFIAFLDREIAGKKDDVEVQSAEWGTPNFFVSHDNVSLPPPQFYEMSLLMRFNDVDYLRKLVITNESREFVPILPVFAGAKDGKIFLLPGDEKYDQLLDGNSRDMLDRNKDIVSLRGEIMHRMEFHNKAESEPFKKVVIKNCDPRFYNWWHADLSCQL